jgi:hypothetical protein
MSHYFGIYLVALFVVLIWLALMFKDRRSHEHRPEQLASTTASSSIPLHDVLICLDCEAVFSFSRHHGDCPVCGSRYFHDLKPWLNRQADKVVAVQFPKPRTLKAGRFV